VNQALLRSVVQVANDSAAFLVGSRHDPGSGGGEI
jgi:hypothetical protein